MSAMAAVNDWPSVLDNLIVTKDQNSAGIYLVKLYIRGKPWVISIDDNFLFSNLSNPTLVNTQIDKQEQGLWQPLLSKAWAKMKGSYA